MHRDVVELAERQDGVLSRANLDDLGVTRSQINTMIRRDFLIRVAPGAFAVRGAPDTHRRRLRIGMLALGERSWVSYEAAAGLHGFDRTPSHAVEFTMFRHERKRSMPFTVHSTKWLPPIDRVRVAGFRVTSATRTILDLAHQRAHRIRVEAAIDSAIRRQLTSPETIARRLDTLRGSGRWGVALIESLLPDTGGHSILERRFLELVRRAGLPRPRTQIVFRQRSRHVARVDFLFEADNVVVEVSGRLGHSSDAERARDAQRRNELQDLGLSVYEYTFTDVTQRSTMVERTLRRRLDGPPQAV